MNRATRSTLPEVSLLHAGAGTTLTLSYLGLIPGFLPVVALTVLVSAVLAAPFVMLGFAAALIAAPPYGVWRLITRARSRSARDEQTSTVRARQSRPRTAHR